MMINRDKLSSYRLVRGAILDRGAIGGESVVAAYRHWSASLSHSEFITDLHLRSCVSVACPGLFSHLNERNGIV